MRPEVHSHQLALEALAEERDCGLINQVFGFARKQQDLEAVVLGVRSVQGLSELRQAWGALSPCQEGQWRSWGLQDPYNLDPRRWPR